MFNDNSNGKPRGGLWVGGWVRGGAKPWIQPGAIHNILRDGRKGDSQQKCCGGDKNLVGLPVVTDRPSVVVVVVVGRSASRPSSSVACRHFGHFFFWQKEHGSDIFCIYFECIHSLLISAGKLIARVEYSPDWAKPALLGSRPATFSCWLVDRLPKQVINKLARKAIGNYSQQIGHDLCYHIRWR